MSEAETTAASKWAPRRPNLVAFLLFLLLAVIYFGPGLLPSHTVSGADFLWTTAPWNHLVPKGFVPSNSQLVDSITVFEPFLQHTRSLLPHIPLWDPYIMGGTPFLADMQSAVFSPFSLPAYILPFWWALGVIAVMKVVVASMGAFVLSRLFKTGFAGAFTCGIVYGFGLFMIAWIPWPLTNVFALIPWMLVATEWVIRRPGVLSTAGLSVVVALQWFGGHPESSIQAIFICIGFFVLRVLQSPGGGVKAMSEAADAGRSRWRALLRAGARPAVAFAGGFVIGTGLAAIVIVPFLELLRNSSDLSARPRSQVHVQPKYFLAAFLPNYFPGSFEIETAFYVGALPLMLAAFAMFRVRVERVVIALAALLSLLIVLGVQPFFGIAGHVPGLDFTYLSRFTILYLLCIALLAGFGLDDLASRPQHRRVAIAGSGIAAGLLVLPAVVVIAVHGSHLSMIGRAAKIAFLFAKEPISKPAVLDPLVHLSSLLVWLVVAGVATVLLIARLSGRLAKGHFAALAVMLVVADLFQAGVGYNPAISESKAVQPVTPAIRFLQRQRPARFAAITPYATHNPIPPDVNIRYGLYDARGYDLPVITQYGNLWTAYVAPATPLLPLDTPSVPLTIFNTLPPNSLKVLSLLGVRDILEEQGVPPLNRPDGLKIVYDGSDARIYENPHALPRTWLVSDDEVVHSQPAAMAALVATGFDPRHVIVTGQALAGLTRTTPSGAPAGGGPRELASPGSARITHYGDEQVTIDAHAARASELVLSDTYYPGWHVTVNGRSEPISRVDYLFRGVAVPAGHDRIVFTYAPSSFTVGWVVSLTVAVLLAGSVGVAVYRRRRSPAVSPSSAAPAPSA